MADAVGLSRRLRLAERLHPVLARHRGWCISSTGGYLTGRFVNAASASEVKGLREALWNMFDPARPINVLSWISALILIVVPLLGAWLRIEKRYGRAEALLARLAKIRTDPSVTPFAREAVAWGSDVTLQLAPDLQEGWPLHEVTLVSDASSFAFPAKWLEAYKRFVVDNNKAMGFDQDGTKYALVRNPTAFTDAPRLTLEIKKTKYSEVQWYRYNIATVQPERDPLMERAIKQGSIDFPSSLCMHAIVVTSDSRVLATKRSHKVAYSPDAWSVSVEEQFSSDDLRTGTDQAVACWARRLLHEELAVESQDYNDKDFRLLSVFLEADTLNCSVCALLPLTLASNELDDILKAKPRKDYEFSEWEMLTYQELIDELRNGNKRLHPSTGYRMFLALANRYGASRVAKIVFGKL